VNGLLIAGIGVLTAGLTAVLTALAETVVKAGSWERRSVLADVELLKALPEDLRTGRGGQALTKAVKRRLVALSAPRTRDRDSGYWLTRNFKPVVWSMTCTAVASYWAVYVFGPDERETPTLWAAITGTIVSVAFTTIVLIVRGRQRRRTTAPGTLDP
jgi:hypothetical protein